MGLFNRSKAGSKRSPSSLQIPDELAQRAHTQYGNSNFVAAAELYSQAVDKLHTMYVVGQCKYRQPSQSDTSIMEGLVSAVEAALAIDSNAPVRSLAEQSLGYLRQIIELPQARLAAGLYEFAIRELAANLRSG
jgi:hypothetical protein